MKRWPAILALLLIGCSQAGNPAAGATITPSAAASPSPDGKPGITPPPPTTVDLRLSVLAFSCKLPISAVGAQGAFISLPQGDVSFDARAAGVYYYDRAYSRWLPVPRAAVAPNGVHYATAEMGESGAFTVHVVDVATGKDTAFHESASATGIDFAPAVLDYTSEGIYIVQAFEHQLAGLWLVNPVTGAVRQVSSSLTPVAMDHGFVWTEALNPADPDPVNTASSAGILPNEVDRIDLSTGSSVQWMYMPGTGLSIVGFDTAGVPLIVASGWGVDLNAQLYIAPKAGTQTKVFKGELVQSLGGGIADSHGVWLGSTQGIYLYSAADGLEKVSDQPGSPANGCF
jgi:hypothetical protein